MKTFFFVLVTLAFFNLSVNAQKTETKPFKIGVGLTAGLPIGDYSDFASLALALDMQGEYDITSAFAITLSAGYLNFVSKGNYGELGVGQIPILAGGKYYFTDKIYGSVQAGVSIYTVQGGGSSFTFAPGFGYKISEKFNFLLKYQSAVDDFGLDISFLGIRAGFTF